MSNNDTDANHATKSPERIETPSQGVVKTRARSLVYGTAALWVICYPVSPFVVGAFTGVSKIPGWFYIFYLAGAFIWFASGCWICSELFSFAEARWPGIRKLAYGAAAAWLICYPLWPVVVATFSENFEPPFWLYLCLVPATFISFASARWLYDEVFRVAERRWPLARNIREILTPLLKGLLFRHHDSS
jgi:hypothetical protein